MVALRSMAAEVVAVRAGPARRPPPRPRRPLPHRDRGTPSLRVVDKLLHAPTVRVKQLAEGARRGQSYADALNKLFGLDPKAVEAVTRADVTAPDGQRCRRWPVDYCSPKGWDTRRSALATARQSQAGRPHRRSLWPAQAGPSGAVRGVVEPRTYTTTATPPATR